MTEVLVEFDDPPRGDPADGLPATERIAATLKTAGIDAPNSLYDEALGYARDGHLGQAQARLQMLLCLDPDDADALLLNAKVCAAQGRPADALAKLDAAVAAGGLAPAGLREHLEGTIRIERAREEEHRARIAAREQGEIKSLRNETRALRSEQVRLEGEVTDTLLRERNWKYATLGVCMVATLVILVLALTRPSGDSLAAVDVAVAAPAVAAPAAAAPAVAKPAAAPAVAKPAVVPAVAKPAAAPAVAAAKPAAGAARVHVVESGDTLYKLAARYYGDASRWEEIARANRSVLSKGTDLSLGMKLRIP